MCKPVRPVFMLGSVQKHENLPYLGLNVVDVQKIIISD